jgi:hypothetical protein
MWTWTWPAGRTASRRLPGPWANIAGLITGLALVVMAGISIGPAFSAFLGHGTRGYFVAQDENCSNHGCTWDGRFQLPDGTVTRPSVSFNDGSPGSKYTPRVRSGAVVGSGPAGS